MKNVPRDNHYVPQLLLRNFADHAGKLWIYDAETNEYRYGNTKSAAFECKLYPPEVERIFTETIDTPADGAIRGLLKREKLAATQWGSFLRFVAAQLQRTPAWLNRAAAVITPIMQETFERVAKFHPEFRDNVRKSFEKAGTSSEEIDEVFRAMETGKCNVSPKKEWVLWQSLAMIDRLSADLGQMRWTFFGVPSGGPELIIGDHAVMLSDEEAVPIGIRNPNIELVMPLSARMVAVARWIGSDSFGELEKGMAELINERTLRYARRFVFAGYQSDSLLSEAVKLRGTGPQVHTTAIQIGEALVILPEYS